MRLTLEPNLTAGSSSGCVGNDHGQGQGSPNPPTGQGVKKLPIGHLGYHSVSRMEDRAGLLPKHYLAPGKPVWVMANSVSSLPN